MINLQLIKEKSDEIKKLNEYFKSHLDEQKEKIVAIFKSLIIEDYKSSLYAYQTVIDFDNNQIVIHAIIRNPVPTEQDTGIVFRFDTSKLESIDSKNSLYDNLISGDKSYLTIT